MAWNRMRVQMWFALVVVVVAYVWCCLVSVGCVSLEIGKCFFLARICHSGNGDGKSCILRIVSASSNVIPAG